MLHSRPAVLRAKGNPRGEMSGDKRVRTRSQETEAQLGTVHTPRVELASLTVGQEMLQQPRMMQLLSYLQVERGLSDISGLDYPVEPAKVLLRIPSLDVLQRRLKPIGEDDDLIVPEKLPPDSFLLVVGEQCAVGVLNEPATGEVAKVQFRLRIPQPDCDG